jgi:nucleoside-diphosphate-sugar epimerase
MLTPMTTLLSNAAAPRARTQEAEHLHGRLRGQRCGITGADGYLGSRLVTELQGVGATVRQLRYRAPERNAQRGIFTGDVRDVDVVSKLVEDCDVVFHVAAYVHRRPRTDTEIRECFGVNVEGTRVVVEACRRAARPPFLVFVSSSSVYGPISTAANEELACRPTTPYGESKLAAETVVRNAAEVGDVEACVIRPSMFFGRGAPGNLKLLARLVRSRVRLLIDAGRARKSITHVSTVVEALALAAAARNSLASGIVLNVSDDEPVSIRAITDALARGLSARPVTLSVPGGASRSLARVWDTALARLPKVPQLSPLVVPLASDAVISTDRLRSVLPFTVRLPALTAIESGEF